MSVDLTSIRLDKNTNLFLSQNLSDYNNKIAFHCRELRRKRLIDSTWVYGGRVFMKIQENVNKEEIKHLKFPITSLVLMIDIHLCLLSVFYCRWVQDPIKHLGWHVWSSNLLNVLAKGSISDVWQGAELAFAVFFMVTLCDHEVDFKRCYLLWNHLLFLMKHLLMAVSTYHCFSLCYYCFASALVLLLRK